VERMTGIVGATYEAIRRKEITRGLPVYGWQGRTPSSPAGETTQQVNQARRLARLSARLPGVQGSQPIPRRIRWLETQARRRARRASSKT
jgi:hypothetical protein